MHIIGMMVNMMVNNEKQRILEDIKAYILRQKGEFISFRLAKEWIKKNNVGEINCKYNQTKKSTIFPYFSQVKNTLKDEGKIKVVRTIERGNFTKVEICKVIKDKD